MDASLRPRSLGEFIGQPRVREQLQLVIEGAKNRGGTPDHILLSGPPGLGKTSLAMIIAAELGSSLLEGVGRMEIRHEAVTDPRGVNWTVRRKWMSGPDTAGDSDGVIGTVFTAVVLLVFLAWPFWFVAK
nr:AAA family ATPase [Streptomyces sp. DSM 41633]